MNAFLDAIVQFLKSAQGVVTSTTTLVTATVALVVALKKLGPALRRITSQCEALPARPGSLARSHSSLGGFARPA